MGFLTGFARPFFHFIYVFLKYIVVIVLLICGGNIESPFYPFGIPFLLQMWLIGLFFAAKNNRPQPWTWLELNVWRPIAEYGWNIAVRKYIARNPENAKPGSPRWREIIVDEKSGDQSEYQNQNGTAKEQS